MLTVQCVLWRLPMIFVRNALKPADESKKICGLPLGYFQYTDSKPETQIIIKHFRA